MTMHYDIAKTEIATRLQHAEHRRSTKRARTQQQPGLTPRRQRFRST